MTAQTPHDGIGSACARRIPPMSPAAVRAARIICGEIECENPKWNKIITSEFRLVIARIIDAEIKKDK